MESLQIRLKKREDKPKNSHGAAATNEAGRANEELEKILEANVILTTLANPAGCNTEITIDDINKSRDLDDESGFAFYKRMRALLAEDKRQLKEARARRETAEQQTKLMEVVATTALGPLRDEMSDQYLARPIAGVTNMEDAQEMIDQLDDMFTVATGIARMVHQQTERLGRWVQDK
ncbi:hypothetical protein LTS15_004938 [Exophiala xenobiotica]|nr:hypothetical protein LTS15_004938 [Exophiala xenobiotica]